MEDKIIIFQLNFESVNQIMGPYLTVPKKEKDSYDDENSRVSKQ